MEPGCRCSERKIVVCLVRVFGEPPRSSASLMSAAGSHLSLLLVASGRKHFSGRGYTVMDCWRVSVTHWPRWHHVAQVSLEALVPAVCVWRRKHKPVKFDESLVRTARSTCLSRALRDMDQEAHVAQQGYCFIYTSIQIRGCSSSRRRYQVFPWGDKLRLARRPTHDDEKTHNSIDSDVWRRRDQPCEFQPLYVHHRGRFIPV